ncbi:LysR family transcriptional regulator ArgP [Kutzneria sp. CA-103260]|uniref:LysR family transcriptional regulator ArgP n=1 Tax=Kutzneria sp. CA-103260 TaxID=2802641 RepID=UPI001BAB4C5E|nr:LysR family transcriptional regulator ArgP [Kutzneria sp. CA-103260]QUQ67925.1 chromosome replication initiation inhibitor protein [Kutzneria sp. CA-103260]
MADLPSDHVRTLLAVVDAGTFDAAAAALHVTPSAVSQRIKALEQRTGRVLLMRTKPVQLTDSGQVVVRFARQLAQLSLDAQAELGLTTAGQPTRLSIAVNADSLATWFLPALAQVPDVCFDLHREDEGHTTQLLREGLVMAAVTSTPDPVQGCSVRPLGSLRYLACASPSFPFESFSTSPVIFFDRSDLLQDRFAAGASPFRHHMPSSAAYLDAVLAGMGWGLIPVSHASPCFAAGTLVNLAPTRHMDVPLFWQQWKLHSPALAATAQSVLATAAAALVQA